MFEALIFDCDGVLVDSEVLAQEVELAALAGIGLDYGRDEFTRRFTGSSAEAMNAAIADDFKRRFDRTIAPDFFNDMGAAIEAAYRQHLQAIPGAVELARAWSRPKAVASSSSQDMVELKLRKVGLHNTFGEHVFTASHARAKPHPDLFLMAADSLETPKARCAVVEDSVNGVIAARRAGMQVIGFTGGQHCGPDHHNRLIASGAHQVFDSFQSIAHYLGIRPTG